jgi:hypothetical protein
MLPKVVKIELPKNARHEDVVKAVNSKLTRQTTDVLRKNPNLVLAIFAFERPQRASSKKDK